MEKLAYTRKYVTEIISWSPIVTDPENCWLSITSVGGKCTRDFKSRTFAKYHKYIKEFHCIWKQ